MKERILFWSPRILTIFAIMFMMIFSFDAFDGDEPLIKKIGSFLIHNIPVLLLVIVLIIAWRRELIGGILILALFIAGCIFFGSFTGNPQSLVVIFPFFLTGSLFLLHHFLYSKKL